MGMTVDDLIDFYPRLYHMATGGAWPSIQQHGLLPTRHLVTTSKLPLSDQTALLTRRRPQSTVITHPVIGTVTVRDQAPLREEFLTPKLTDMTASQWLDVLNNRVFFWLHEDKLEGLLNARRYRHHEQDVITIDTRSLIESHQKNIYLSPINSGATLYPNAPQRGSGTFMPITQYPFAERRKGRSLSSAISELAVVGGVPDLVRHVVAVHRRRGSDVLGTLHP